MRRRIIEGTLQPGDRLSERNLSAELGISTTPIKEAFRILQTEGLITSVPRRGSFVSVSYKENVLQLIYMRGALEGTAAYFASMSATEEEITEMEQALETARRRIDGEEGTEEIQVEACSDRFHEILRCACRNEYLTSLLQSMRSLDTIIRSMANETVGEESRRAYRDHCAILEAVKIGDAELAERLMIGHIRRVGMHVVLNGNAEEK